MHDDHIVTVVALVLSAIAFIIYVVEAFSALRSKPTADAKAIVAKAAGVTKSLAAPSVDDLTKLLEALSKVTDSLSKAGPSLTSLIASVLFLAIAALSSGALRSAQTSSNATPTTDSPPQKQSSISDRAFAQAHSAAPRLSFCGRTIERA